MLYLAGIALVIAAIVITVVSIVRIAPESFNENDFATLAEAQGILAAWRERY